MPHSFPAPSRLVVYIVVPALIAVYLSTQLTMTSTKPSMQNLNGELKLPACSSIGEVMLYKLVRGELSIAFVPFPVQLPDPSALPSPIVSSTPSTFRPSPARVPDIYLPQLLPMCSIQANIPSAAVFKKPLALFSQSPVTGFYRDGYCRVGPEDKGNHAVAGKLSILPSPSFLPSPNPYPISEPKS